MCVALSFLFSYLLSTRYVYPQIGRAFEAPIGHKTLLCGHMMLLAPFVAYFLKNNYINLRVWERSLISVSIGVYLGLIEVWDLIGRKHREERRSIYSWSGTWHRDWTHLLQRPVSTLGGDIVAEERPENEQYFTRVRCEVESTSHQHEEVNRKRIELRSVSGHSA